MALVRDAGRRDAGGQRDGAGGGGLLMWMGCGRGTAARCRSRAIDTVTVPGLVAGWGELYAWVASAPWADAAGRRRAARARGASRRRRSCWAAIDEARARRCSSRTPTACCASRRWRRRSRSCALRVRERSTRGRWRSASPRGSKRSGARSRLADLASFRPSVEAPLRVRFRGVDVLSAGPNCSGRAAAAGAGGAGGAPVSSDPLGADAGALAAIFAAGWRQREATLADPRFAPQDLDAWLGPEAVARAVAAAAGRRRRGGGAADRRHHRLGHARRARAARCR